ncbi:dTDP-4-dehydrorhamnose 3,5-epimerase family protein [Candidatus Roizmanbacteria bacterium]|nr:dTDP-4-dehydrorhamnose 3,5-epimerase family protein [Candidatus Roizmanbacteria bacterium]
MQITEVGELIFPEIKIIQYNRFMDERGFFAEIYRRSDFQKNERLSFLSHKEFKQANISFSKAKVVRGLHFQFDPPMEKLVRPIQGAMIDLFIDIRIGSPFFGKIGGHAMSTTFTDHFNQWIYIPSGFAHGAIFLEPTMLEYFCTEEYNPDTERTISPLAKDIDWSLFEVNLKKQVDQILHEGPLISQKDQNGDSLGDWKSNPDSQKFLFTKESGLSI